MIHTGAGKTTMLNLFADRVQGGKIEGKITINGLSRKKISKNKWLRLAAYVMQDDVMMANLSVRETLTFSALLRVPGAFTHPKNCKERVEAVIDELGLNDCAKTRIGSPHSRGISGGQRKRVSIGYPFLLSSAPPPPQISFFWTEFIFFSTNQDWAYNRTFYTLFGWTYKRPGQFHGLLSRSHAEKVGGGRKDHRHYHPSTFHRHLLQIRSSYGVERRPLNLQRYLLLLHFFEFLFVLLPNDQFTHRSSQVDCSSLQQTEL